LESPGQIQKSSFGCIETHQSTSFRDRLESIYRQLSQVIQEVRPNAVAMEILYFAKHAKSLALVGHARGVCILSAAHAHLPVFEYTPKQVKLALTGSGAADKVQMQNMVQRLLKLSQLPQPDDAADALAVALCHSQIAPLRERIEALGV
jgi:crossover junction endodeoxyribonuclease RuvC